MSGPRTRIGVIGAGNIATIAQLPTLVARDDVELRALVTRQENPEPLLRRWGFGKAFPTIEAMIADEDLDAVFVLTPDPSTSTPHSWPCVQASTSSVKSHLRPPQ